ncbi:MAG: nucleotide exchange factor GrpE [bacterium]|nr:nucleotide exchange factor GrpE [bacterium]
MQDKKKQLKKAKIGVDVEKIESELKEVTYRLARALADYQNLEKRMGDEVRREVNRVKEVIMKEVLDVYEAVEKLWEHKREDSEIRAVKGKFDELLRRMGVKEVEVKEGDRFNPDVAECVGVVEGEEGKIVEVIRKGYLLSDKLIRPVLVRVGRKKDTKFKQKEVDNG